MVWSPASLLFFFIIGKWLSLFQSLHIIGYLLQLLGYADVLRAMNNTLTTTYAMVGLSHFWHRTVEANEENASVALVILVHDVARQGALVLAFVVMHENAGNVDAIWTRHAIFAVVARNGLHAYDFLGHVVEEILFFLCQRHQRTIRQQVVFQVFHIGHAAQHGEHAFRGAGIPESP